MATTIEHDVRVEELSVEHGHAMFEELVQDRLGISREAFLKALDAGEFDNTDSEEVVRLCLLAPFAR